MLKKLPKTLLMAAMLSIHPDRYSADGRSRFIDKFAYKCTISTQERYKITNQCLEIIRSNKALQRISRNIVHYRTNLLI